MKPSIRTRQVASWQTAAVVGLAFAAFACSPKYPKCKDDGDCRSHGEVCVESVCKQCRDSAQCKHGFECREGACFEKPQCDVNEDCNDGMLCREHRCVPQCTTDSQCGPTERCKKNHCVPKAECDADHPCPDGSICQNSKCVIPTESDAALRPPVVVTDCQLSTIHFDFNDFSLGETARADADRNAECIKRKNRGVIIQGNCDERGTEEYNIMLGNKRADSVRRYLVRLGVPENLISIVSYGEERPQDPHQNEAAWAQNRRAEFVWR